MSTLQSSPISPTAFTSLPASGVRSGHSFPSSTHPRAATVFPCRHIVPAPLSSGRFGATRGMLQAERRGSSARSTTRPDSYPVRLADGRRPRDHNARFGRCDVPGGGTHLDERCRALRRTMSLNGHTPCPGSPEAPSGRPGVLMFPCPPLRPATGRRLPAPSRRWRISTAPPAACAPAPRSPASAPARRRR